MTSVLAYIGLGSNLQQPAQQVRKALDWLSALDQCRLVAASSLYRSAPIGPQDQPDFINAVAGLETRLAPLALLDALQALEQRAGRVRHRRWGERSLDLDILLYGENVIRLPRLRVPHKEMENRAFVLQPLAEIAPTLTLPNGRQIDHLLPAVADQRIRRL